MIVNESTENSAIAVWSLWLDGDSVNAIANWGPISSRSAINTILQSDPPAEIAKDPRYVNKGRFFWIAIKSGLSDAFVVVKSPRRYTSAAFRKALLSIRRTVREEGGDLELNVVEGADGVEGSSALIRMVFNKGYRCYQFDLEGYVLPYTPVLS